MNRKAFGFTVLVLLAGGFLGSSAQACEICDSTGILGHLAYNAFCRGVGPDDIGATHCNLVYDPLTPSVDCYESGSFCSTFTVTGGGGGAGGGTSGGGCGGGGFCPASCFSCGGGVGGLSI